MTTATIIICLLAMIGWCALLGLWDWRTLNHIPLFSVDPDVVPLLPFVGVEVPRAQRAAWRLLAVMALLCAAFTVTIAFAVFQADALAWAALGFACAGVILELWLASPDVLEVSHRAHARRLRVLAAHGIK